MKPARVTAEAARRRLLAGGEIALLDVREAAAFGDGHPLFAIPCPYGRLELSAVALVPRRDCPLLLVDDDDGVAERAARRLAACGYTDITLVIGGVPAWKATGYGLFAGVNVPSKTLGELLEHAHHPRTIDAPTLAQWQREGRAHLFFDARPPAEYAKMRIGGARCVPNGELAHRLATVATDDETPIVITCAGRTRGIVGALGLRALGVRNPVYALENGTQGWALAGLPLDRGARADPLPTLDAAATAASRARAARLIDASGLTRTDVAGASALLAEPGRTPFLFDLRNVQERADRPAPGAVPVLAGQLIQATDQYVGVRNARLVLMDDTGLRAGLAGLFLRALGYEVHVLALDDEPGAGVPVVPAPQLMPPAPPPMVDPRVAWARAGDGFPLFDLRSSSEWEERRLVCARWSMRVDLPGPLPPGTSRVLLQGEAGVVAGAARDLAEIGITAEWLAADLDTCAAAGWPVEAMRRPLGRDKARDRVWFVHDRHDGNAEASRRYLAWETGLIAQLDAEERATFGTIPIDALA
ncbi:rhodanese-like domain-containing protein [Ancylobacter sp. TS-1]|uniref:rhodanese-like domain-containing protein n=1 Tax=Ancylobacter sp. TS-1 TaxID=1850374 RepID=UPI001265CC6A|nr:rhodanese-like domain-containing protein [Ancylobacter sp. TS-1]QFR31812.1 rhodanese [Ancylobacter sp. TS-1]